MNNHSTNPIAIIIVLVLAIAAVGYGLAQLGLVSVTKIIFWSVIIVGAFVFISGLRIVDQFERAVVLTLGKYTSTRQPGLTWILVGIQRMIMLDMRITTIDIPQQEVITKDNVPVGINAVVYFQVVSAEKAILNIKDFALAVSQYAQAALRDVIGQGELDPLLSESERERRAVIIRSEGEFSASEKLAQAAERLSQVPGGLSLRTLATIEKINPDPSKTVIFALPVEFMEGFKSLGEYLKVKK